MSDECRHRLVYGIPVWAVDRTTGRIIPGQVRVGYIGQSQQTVKEREEQHRAGRFGDLIVGGSFTIAEGWWTKQELDDWEEHYIRAGVPLTEGGEPQRPIYNDTHNRDNPERIEVRQAVKHRQARQPEWTPPAKDAVWVPRQRTAPASTWVARWNTRPSWLRIRWWTRPRRVVAGWSALWLLVAVPVAVFVAAGEVATGWDGLAYGAGVATSAVGVLMPKRRRSRRTSRR